MTEVSSNGRARALITGTGAVTPLGTGTENFWDAALHGKSGIGEITLFDPSPYPSRIAGECWDFDPTDFVSKKQARRMDRYAQLGIAAGIQAAESAGIVDLVRETPERVAIVMGSGIGGISTWEREYRVLNERGAGRVSPFLITMMVPNMAAGQLGIALGATGPSQCPVLACATGGEAIAEGLELIRRGDADVVIAGSSEAPITPLSMAGFCAIRAVSRRNEEPARASRPFDEGRDGFVMSEGAGAVIMESEEHAERRGAEPIAAVAGYGRTTDAYHVTAPDEEGRGVERAMVAAFADAGISPEDVGHVNAHATATPTGDGPETKAIARVVPHALVSGTKSMTGHSFGAVGATEGIMCALALKHKVVPPTINLEQAGRRLRGAQLRRKRGRRSPGSQGRHLQFHGIRRSQCRDRVYKCRIEHEMSIRDLIAILPEPLRQRSLTHPSVADPYESNGRLEFLGDSVLNSRVAELVFHGYPELLEGDLTRIRAHLVRKSFLATVGRSEGIEEIIESSVMNDSVIADTVEAIIGAAYLIDRDLVLRVLDEIFNPAEVDTDELRDWKTLLQETLQADGLRPIYRVISKQGPAHRPSFTSRVSVEGKEVATGTGSSIKESEQTAARNALEILGIRPVPRSAVEVHVGA